MDDPHWIEYLNQFKDAPILHIPATSTKVAVIVEPRSHPLLPLVVRNFMYLLKGWACLIIHGTENGNFIKNSLADIPNIQYVELPVSNLTTTDYNNYLCSPIFWETLQGRGYQHALSFEIDTLLLCGDLDRFLGYAYIGAPWCIKWYGYLEVGNSGFCLRNVSKMLHITRTCPRKIVIPNTRKLGKRPVTDDTHNNDIYFAYWCKKKRYLLPPPCIAGQFSAETVWYGVPCGFHKPHVDKFPSGVYERALSKRYI